MKLLFALAVTNDDSDKVEKFLDFVRTISGRKGHLLLAFMSDVHDEMKARVRISAELSFEVVHEIAINPFADRSAPPTVQANSQFRQVAQHVANVFHWPFVWLEWHVTPKACEWRELLSEAYEAQPYGFFGSRMRIKPKTAEAKEIFFMGKVGIYPATANSLMLSPPDSPVPLEIASSNLVISRMGVTKLIQQANIASEGDLLSVRDDAILISGDRSGLLKAQQLDSAEELEHMRTRINETPPDPLISRLATNIQNGARR